MDVEFRPGAPAAPAGLAADRPLTNAAPALHWRPVPNARAYRVQRDGADAGRVTGTTFTDAGPVADGTHRYTVAAEGGSGLHGEDSDPVDVVIDTTAPDTGLDTYPTAPTAADVTFAFTTGAGAVGAECRTDGAAFAACTSPVHLHLADGDHRVEVRAVDEAGNADPTPAAFDVAVDATPPGVPALTATPDTGLPLGSGLGRVDVHVVAAADAVRVVVRRGAVVLADGPAPTGDLSDDGLADQTHYAYTAVAYDAAGNASAVAHAAADTPDRTAPATPAAPAGSGYPLRVAWADEAGTTFTLERDGVAVARTAHAAVTDVDAVDRRRRRCPRRGRGRRGRTTVTLPGSPSPTAARPTATSSTARTRPATSAPTRPPPPSWRSGRRRLPGAVDGVVQTETPIRTPP